MAGRKKFTEARHVTHSLSQSVHWYSVAAEKGTGSLEYIERVTETKNKQQQRQQQRKGKTQEKAKARRDKQLNETSEDEEEEEEKVAVCE